MFALEFSYTAQDQLKRLKSDTGMEKYFKAVVKALKYLQESPRHPSLNTHIYETIFGPNGEKVFEAYAQNNTASAYRIFFYYGPAQKVITILAVCAHP